MRASTCRPKKLVVRIVAVLERSQDSVDLVKLTHVRHVQTSAMPAASICMWCDRTLRHDSRACHVLTSRPVKLLVTHALTRLGVAVSNVGALGMIGVSLVRSRWRVKP